MIRNSVTHLRSYTNSAITDITGNSANIIGNSAPILPEIRRERRYLRIEWRVFECFVMFDNVLRVFHTVLSVS